MATILTVSHSAASMTVFSTHVLNVVQHLSLTAANLRLESQSEMAVTQGSFLLVITAWTKVRLCVTWTYTTNFTTNWQSTSKILQLSSLQKVVVVERRFLANEFSILRSTCIWRVTVNRPLQVSQLGQLSLSSFRGRFDKGVVSCSRMSALVAPSGEYLQGEGLVWLIGTVVCSLAAVTSLNCSLARAMDGHNSAAAPLALADQLPLLMIVKRSWSGFLVRISRCNFISISKWDLLFWSQMISKQVTKSTKYSYNHHRCKNSAQGSDSQDDEGYS